MGRLKIRQNWSVDICNKVESFNPVTPYFEKDAAGNMDESVQKGVEVKHIESNNSKSFDEFKASEGTVLVQNP